MRIITRVNTPNVTNENRNDTTVRLQRLANRLVQHTCIAYGAMCLSECRLIYIHIHDCIIYRCIYNQISMGTKPHNIAELIPLGAGQSAGLANTLIENSLKIAYSSRITNYYK